MHARTIWTVALLCLSFLAGCGQGSGTANGQAPAASSPLPSIKAATVVADTLKFPGPSSAYAIDLTASGYTIATQGAAPVALPANIKRVDFDDASFGIGIDSNTAQLYRVWRAAFNQPPDLASLSYWVNLMDIGLTLRLAAESLVNTDAFRSTYGSAQSSTQLVTQLFENILRRAPTQEDLRFFTTGLDSQRFTAAVVLIVLSESPEYANLVTAETRNIIRVNSLGNRLAANEAFIAVSHGKFGLSYNNRALVSVTICRPNTTICQTIDDIVLDTGSHGLRLSPGVNLLPELQLPPIVNEAGQTLGHCARFGGNTVQLAYWGGVHRADVKLASMTASSLPIHIVDTRENPQFFPIPEDCQNGAPVVNEVESFNGVLGIGEDVACGAVCASVPTASYYACISTGCERARVSIDNQIRNPVSAFASGYNNGTVIRIDDVPLEGAAITLGKLVFGIGSQPNNQLGNAKVFPLASDGTIDSVLNGTRYRGRFDTGAPLYVLNDANIPRCDSPLSSFFCPPSPVTVAVANSSGNTSDLVSLRIAAPSPASIVSGQHIGQYESNPDGKLYFGLPFFFGRSVFTAIDGASTPAGPGPYVAY